MIQNEQERQEWRQIRKAANATPDPEIHVIRGLEWAKVRRLVCDWCGDTFWGQQCLDEPFPEQQQDFRYGNGRRMTCGDPDCDEKEHSYQNGKRQREWLSKQPPPGTTPKNKSNI